MQVVGCKMWVHVTFNAIVLYILFEYVKLVEIAIVMVLGNVEDECIVTIKERGYVFYVCKPLMFSIPTQYELLKSS